MQESKILGSSASKTSQDRHRTDPQPPCATGVVVVLSADGVLAKDLEEHLHHAGYAVRVVAAVREILAFEDPASLMLVLVDTRAPEWDMLRTDPSLRHVLLIGMVPSGYLYSEDHCLFDLARGMDSVHDLDEGYRLLIVKVRAYLRRAGFDYVRRGVYQVGDVVLDGDAHVVTIAGQPVKLTAKPFAILATLMQRPSKVFSRSELLHLVWGYDFAVSEHTLDVHVHALRQQLNLESNRRCELITIKRIGFKLKPVSAAGSIRTRRARPRFKSISGSHGRSRQTRGLAPRRIRTPSDPLIKLSESLCISSACG